MSNRVYDILKWCALVAFDAIGFAYEQLADVWNLPYGEEVYKTFTIISILIGTLIGVSGITYANKNKNKELEKGE